MKHPSVYLGMLTFSEMTHLMETRIMAKMRYLPSRGTTRLVGGIISTTSRKNTCRLMRMEMESVTCIK